ncbi:MAG: response regulator [Chloroflexi bacterium]|nr:response regulator [Chloroflexota bacterium]
MFHALVVDDNRATADSIVRVLTVLGIQARAAYGPGPGMTILNGETPNMIFLDINMPGVSGYEILSYVCREPRLAKVPVIICTSDDQPQTRQLAMEAGASDFLLKPVTVDALENVLRKVGFL